MQRMGWNGSNKQRMGWNGSAWAGTAAHGLEGQHLVQLVATDT
jgi:hypothetical protein